MPTFIEIETMGGPTSLNIDSISCYSPARPREDGTKCCYIQHAGHMHLALGFDWQMLAEILRKNGVEVIPLRGLAPKLQD